MKYQNFMVDIETFGNKPYSVITSIGAVKFGGGKILDEFYIRVCPKSCVNFRLRMDVDTVMWWLGQNKEAMEEMTHKDRETLPNAMDQFSKFLGTGKNIRVWGNGASFDNVLIGCAYDVLKKERPWPFYNDMCYRTIKNLHPDIKIDRQGTHHNALDDAKDQAIHLMKMIPEL